MSCADQAVKTDLCEHMYVLPVFAQVNEAVNDLLIDEEDFEGLKSSIQTFDNFDQVRGQEHIPECCRHNTLQPFSGVRQRYNVPAQYTRCSICLFFTMHTNPCGRHTKKRADYAPPRCNVFKSKADLIAVLWCAAAVFRCLSPPGWPGVPAGEA